MAKRVNYIITDNNITVNYDGQTHIVSRTDALADKLIKAVREQNLDAIPDLVSAAKRIERFGKGNFVVRDGQIIVNGQVAPKVLGDKILKFSNEGLPYQPLVKFAENLQKNPSYRSVNELFQFLEKNDHPITEDGNFIAYKKVRSDYKDVHTGTMDNSPGKIVEMPRNQVNEDSTQTCSEGLHAANWEYASSFYSGGLFLELEINPADVVSIPIDYNQSKMRVCKYKVLGVVDSAHSSDLSLRRTRQDDCCDHQESCCDEDEEDDYEDEEYTCAECGADVEEWEDICEDCEYEEEEEEEEEDDSDYPFESDV